MTADTAVPSRRPGHGDAGVGEPDRRRHDDPNTRERSGAAIAGSNAATKAACIA